MVDRDSLYPPTPAGIPANLAKPGLRYRRQVVLLLLALFLFLVLYAILLAGARMQERGWILRSDLIWYKPDVPPRHEKDRLPLTHDHFFHFVKKPTEGRASYFYDKSEVESPGHDVIKLNVAPGTNGHSATFPPALIRPRILSSCPKGGLVLDPFAGTGTALVVAVEHGRRALGFEVTDKFAEAARQALQRSRPLMFYRCRFDGSCFTA
jgi:DNA modification methylase